MQTAPELFKQLHWVRRIDPPYYVNSAAISADGERVVAGTFFLSYKPETAGLPMEFGTYCFDREGKQLWADKFVGAEGVYSVAISADGSTAAAGGRIEAEQGFIRAYETKTGDQLANYSTGARVNQLALSKDGTTLVAGADQIYFAQQEKGSFPANPLTYQLPGGTSNNVQSVSMPLDGSWFVFGDYEGTVYLGQNESGSIKAYPSAAKLLGSVHCVAASGNGNWFIAVGDSQDLYLFTPESIKAGEYVTKYQLAQPSRTGWAAISLEGDMISVVQNNGNKGMVYCLQNVNGTLSPLWSQSTLANPNSTSLDASGELVTVADGYPDGTPGRFYLFDGTNGTPLWNYETPNMNWPMFISSLGKGIVAGSDYGNVYYFIPRYDV